MPVVQSGSEQHLETCTIPSAFRREARPQLLQEYNLLMDTTLIITEPILTGID
jgi:hypothetical protein